MKKLLLFLVVVLVGCTISLAKPTKTDDEESLYGWPCKDLLVMFSPASMVQVETPYGIRILVAIPAGSFSKEGRGVYWWTQEEIENKMEKSRERNPEQEI